MKIDIKKIIRFMFTGLGCTIIDFGLSFFIILLITLDAPTGAVVAHIISFTLAQIFGYYASKYWVFKTKSKRAEINNLTRYAIVTLVNLAWSSALIWLLIVLATKWQLSNDIVMIQSASKLIVGTPLGIVAYYMYKGFVFNED